MFKSMQNIFETFTNWRTLAYSWPVQFGQGNIVLKHRLFQTNVDIMEDKISPCCPLCPLIVQKDVQQLAEHLGSFHKLENSGLILAGTMWSSQVGYQGVVHVLKDVQEINRKLENMNSLVCDGQSDKHQLRVKHTEFVEDMKKKSFQDGEVKDIKHDEYIEAKTKVKLENIDVKKGSDETDVPNVIEDIVEVKQELIDYELKNEVERSEYSQPCYCERSDQILKLKEQVSCLVSQKNKLKSQYFHYFFFEQVVADIFLSLHM